MKLKELFAKPGTWTQRTWARNAIGEEVSEFSNNATCFCLLGAIRRYGNAFDGPTIRWRVSEKLNGELIDSWNDAPERTQADVLKLCEELDI